MTVKWNANSFYMDDMEAFNTAGIPNLSASLNIEGYAKTTASLKENSAIRALQPSISWLWFSKWPRLAVMTKDMLSMQATSASSERAFSTGVDVFGIAINTK